MVNSTCSNVIVRAIRMVYDERGRESDIRVDRPIAYYSLSDHRSES